MTAPTPRQKGDELESIVHAIESTILQAAPGFKEGTFRLQSKRIVIVEGVRHEIDIFVTALLPVGYQAIFIFECKNWQEKVGKNEIIIFSEKINATGAQKGFFVARSFTADAVAQAAKDHRMELLTATELDPANVVAPPNIISTHIGRTSGNVQFHGSAGDKSGRSTPLDLSGMSLLVDGNPLVASDYVQAFIDSVCADAVNNFPWDTVSEGVHTVPFTGKRVFPAGSVLGNGNPLHALSIEGRAEVQLDRAVVVSAFEVKTRGRVITVEINSPAVQMTAQIVELPPL